MKATSTSQCDRPLSTTAFVKSNRRTKSLTLSNSRWLAYATAGIASGFGLASAAEGEIHYSGLVNVTMQDIRSATFPLIGSASLHFYIYDSGSAYVLAGFWITGAESASARVDRGQVADIKRESPVSLGPFISVGTRSTHNIRTLYGFYSNFARHGGGFVGFRFNIGKGIQYGWARLKVSEAPPFVFRFIIKDYAWGDAGEPISAGQRKSFEEKVNLIPNVGSLGLLALGAGGLEAWRDARGQAPTGN